MTGRRLTLTLLLVLTFGSSARAQIDLDGLRRGVQGCPDLAADPGLGGLAATLCRPGDRTSLDAPIGVRLPAAVAIRAGDFTPLLRKALLDLATGGLGVTRHNQLDLLLRQGAVLSRSQESLRRALLAEAAALDATNPALAAQARAQAAALIAGTFDAAIPELLATRVDRDRVADLRAGLFARIGGFDTVDSYSAGGVQPVVGEIGGVPLATDPDGRLIYSSADLATAGNPFFVGPDGIPDTADDLPFVTTNPVAGAAGYSLSAPFTGLTDRFDEQSADIGIGIVVPKFTQTAKISVPSLSQPGQNKTVEVYGVYNPLYLLIAGCTNPTAAAGLAGTLDPGTLTCTKNGEDVTAQAQAVGCTSVSVAFRTSRFDIGTNADGDCIEVNTGNGGVTKRNPSGGFPQFVPTQIQAEVIPLLGDPALRPPQSRLEPTDLTDLVLRSFPIPARPLSPNGSTGFPPVSGAFRRHVDAVSGAPIASSGLTCSIRVNGSFVAIGPNGVAGDGDDLFPSSGACLLWGAPDPSGVQHLAADVADRHAANQTLFHELCSASFDADTGHCRLDAINDPDVFLFLSAALGGSGSLAAPLVAGLTGVRTAAQPFLPVGEVQPGILEVQLLPVNPLGPTDTAGQDIGLNLERRQAGLLGCGANFASPCSPEQASSWMNDPAIGLKLPVGGIDLLNADASVLTQEFAVRKAQHADELVGTGPGGTSYLPGVNYSRNGTLVMVSNSFGGSTLIETGAYLSLTPAAVTAMTPAQRASYQHGGANKVQADGWIEPMPWAVDPNALATFGAIVFQSDPNDPIQGSGNVFNPNGEYCGRWMKQNPVDTNTPFNQTCTALETISANYERLLIGAEIVGQDHVFDPPETLEELAAMLDDDPSNDATGDPISGPDGIFARNQRVFSQTQMDFQVLPAGSILGANIVNAPADAGTDPTHSAALAFFQSYDPSTCAASKCYLNVAPILVDPGDSPTGGNVVVIDLPIAQPVMVDGAPGKINLALLEMNDLAALRRLFSGETVTVAGHLVQMTKTQRDGLLGPSEAIPASGIDINGDGLNDLDQNRDGVWDGQDDFTPGPVSDDSVLCGSGIRGDRLLEDGIQYEPWRADQAPGSPAFQSLFPNGLPPRSPVFCRSLNALLGTIGAAPDGRTQFAWHGGIPTGATDSDGDHVPDGIDNCPTVANADQADTDADGVGDLCDNCVLVPNPRVPAGFLTENPWATLSGGQRDDDHDGIGNVCDGDLYSPQSTNVGPQDTANLKASVGHDRRGDTCGLTHDRPCAVFDLNLGQNTDGVNNISPADTARFKQLLGLPPGPKCPLCTGATTGPLPCTAGAQGACN